MTKYVLKFDHGNEKDYRCILMATSVKEAKEIFLTEVVPTHPMFQKFGDPEITSVRKYR
jgi:hypothetical protein